MSQLQAQLTCWHILAANPAAVAKPSHLLEDVVGVEFSLGTRLVTARHLRHLYVSCVEWHKLTLSLWWCACCYGYHCVAEAVCRQHTNDVHVVCEALCNVPIHPLCVEDVHLELQVWRVYLLQYPTC